MTERSPLPPRWSEALNADFMEMWNAGRSLEEISQRFGISRDAAYARATRLRRNGRDLERRVGRDNGGEARQRRCLGCGRSFMSSHAGNRLCWTCSQSDAMRGLT